MNPLLSLHRKKLRLKTLSNILRDQEDQKFGKGNISVILSKRKPLSIGKGNIKREKLVLEKENAK